MGGSRRLPGLLLLLTIIGCGSPSTETPEAAPSAPAVTAVPQAEVDEGESVEVATRTDPTPTEPLKRIYFGEWYVDGGETHQRLDIFLPEANEAPFPTILALHGGGFRAGSRAFYTNLAGHLNELGYALVAADYRLAPRFTFPAQVEDAFCALAWMYANYETYRFDAERFAVMGDSAGGNLAAMVATADEPGRYLKACPYTLPATKWIDGAVLFYPPTDFTSTDGHRSVDVRQSLEPYFGAEYDEIPVERLVEASPIRWVDGSEPPFLVIQGGADSIVPSWTTEKFADTLDQAGVIVDMVLIEGAGHGFIVEKLTNPEMTQSLAALEPFLAAVFGE